MSVTFAAPRAFSAASVASQFGMPANLPCAYAGITGLGHTWRGDG